mgnify:CR=1 FL=1
MKTGKTTEKTKENKGKTRKKHRDIAMEKTQGNCTRKGPNKRKSKKIV